MSRPNFIFLHSHNTGRHVQPYGYAVPTPNLQRLAEEGMLFRQAFAAAPTCSPSRGAFLTGQCPHSAGIYGLAHRGFPMSDTSHHLANVLRTAGYQTVLAGVEHTTNGEPVGYSRVLDVQNTHAEHVRPAVIEFLSNAPEQPFFLSVGLTETHRPFPDPDPANHPAEDARYCMPPQPLPDSPEIRQDIAAFKASARVMDDCWGAILDTLDAAGLADNTLVCCFSDHGLQFPLNMCNITDHGLGVYLAVRGPGGFEGGKVSDSIVSLIDLVPTLYDLAGMAVPDWVEGESLLPLAADPARPIHDEVFGEVTYHAAYEPQRCVRTDRYKYIRRYDRRDRVVLPNTDDGLSKSYLLERGFTEQPRDEELLFDLVFDPCETNNLIADVKHSATMEDMRNRLDRWMEKTHDPLLTGTVPAPDDGMVNNPDDASCHAPTAPASTLYG